MGTVTAALWDVGGRAWQELKLFRAFRLPVMRWQL